MLQKHKLVVLLWCNLSEAAQWYLEDDQIILQNTCQIGDAKVVREAKSFTCSVTGGIPNLVE